MHPVITAFQKSPDGGKGLARDTRVRWAFEEVGEPYDVRLVSFQALKEPPHLALSPFGQIPTYEDDDLSIFETCSIVFHIAEQNQGCVGVSLTSSALNLQVDVYDCEPVNVHSSTLFLPQFIHANERLVASLPRT